MVFVGFHSRFFPITRFNVDLQGQKTQRTLLYDEATVSSGTETVTASQLHYTGLSSANTNILIVLFFLH